VFLAFEVLDTATTATALDKGSAEVNPVMWVLQQHGDNTWMIAKLAVALFIAAFIVRRRGVLFPAVVVTIAALPAVMNSAQLLGWVTL
jgi:hypothetical protein